MREPYVHSQRMIITSFDILFILFQYLLMDLFDAITAFIRAAERNGFTSAARDLGVTQPHVTRAVQQLEQRLGARLFNRTTRQLVLTDEGRDYLERCRAIMASLDDADQSIGARANTLTGELRIFAPVSLGRAWVVPRLAEFLGRHPQLGVNLVLDDRPRDLVEERLDLGLRIGPLPASTQRARHLGDIDRWIVATPAYWLEHGKPEAPVDLSRHESLIFDGPITVDRLRMCRGKSTVDVALNGRFRTNSSEAIQEAMLLGRGVCAAPTWLVLNDLSQGRIERALADWRVMPPLPLFVTYPETRVPSERVRRCVDWLAYSLQADGLFQ